MVYNLKLNNNLNKVTDQQINNDLLINKAEINY